MSKRIELWLDAVVKAGVTPKARLVCFSLATQIMTKREYSGALYAQGHLFEIAEHTGLSESSVKRHVRHAVDAGLLKVTGPIEDCIGEVFTFHLVMPPIHRERAEAPRSGGPGQDNAAAERLPVRAPAARPVPSRHVRRAREAARMVKQVAPDHER